MIVGGLGMALSLVLLVLTAAGRSSGVHMAYAHMAVAAAVSIGFALAYIASTKALAGGGARESALAANTARYLGMVWAWGALGLGITYGTGLLAWREWPHFLAACVILSGLCLFYSATLNKDAAAGREDPTMLRIGNTLTIVLLAGMLITMAGLVIDGKMTRFLTPRHTDWAANNIFFFGALAMAAISGYALWTRPVGTRQG